METYGDINPFQKNYRGNGNIDDEMLPYDGDYSHFT